MRGEEPAVYLNYGRIKIGKSSAPRQREKDFSGYPFPVQLLHQIATNDMTWLESRLHRQYQPDRDHGEWFSLEDGEVRALLRCQVVDRVPDEDFWLYTKEAAEGGSRCWGAVPHEAGQEEDLHTAVAPFRAGFAAAGWRVTEQVVRDLFCGFWRLTCGWRENVICIVGLRRAEVWRVAFGRAAS